MALGYKSRFGVPCGTHKIRSACTWYLLPNSVHIALDDPDRSHSERSLCMGIVEYEFCKSLCVVAMTKCLSGWPRTMLN